MTESEIPQVPIVNVAEIMQDIREQLVPTAWKRATYAAAMDRLSVSAPALNRLENLLESVRIGAAQVGSMPPEPPTFRAVIGAKLVWLVQRALFWYTPQLHAFHLQVSAALDEQMRVNRMLAEELREVQLRMKALKQKPEQPPIGTNTG